MMQWIALDNRNDGLLFWHYLQSAGSLLLLRLALRHAVALRILLEPDLYRTRLSFLQKTKTQIERVVFCYLFLVPWTSSPDVRQKQVRRQLLIRI
jgi:hypothetical protein